MSSPSAVEMREAMERLEEMAAVWDARREAHEPEVPSPVKDLALVARALSDRENKQVSMSVKQFLLDFLRDLEHRVPPPSRCHHAITFAQYGGDALGGEDRLALQVNVNGRFFCFFLDEGDFTEAANALAAHVAHQIP